MANIIRIETGAARGRSVRLPEGKPVGIGRDPRCAILLDDPLVSRVHGILTPDGDRWRLEDRNSRNSTQVNGVPIQCHVLQHGDAIRVGDTSLTFSTVEEDPLLGRTVGGYRIASRLGAGAMGTVYLAQQLAIDRPVAFKVLAPRLATDAEFVAQFLQEARAAGRLNHPNVVQVYDAGDVDGVTYIAMEFLPGGSVQELLEKNERLSVPEVISMAKDAARALAFAERFGLVHRDIKPANLLLTADRQVKIGDLGIAMTVRGSDSAGGVDPSARRASDAPAPRVAGSPRYMAPEQAQGRAVDHRADIYALGSTVFQMLCGSTPFNGSTVVEILRAKMEREAPSLGSLVPDVPAAMDSAVAKMLERRPEARYSSAADVLTALEAIEQDAASGGPAGARARRASASRRVSPKVSSARVVPPRAGPSRTSRAGPARTGRARSGGRGSQSSQSKQLFVLGGCIALAAVLFVAARTYLSPESDSAPSSTSIEGAGRDGGAPAPDAARTTAREAKDTLRAAVSSVSASLREAQELSRDWQRGTRSAASTAAALRELLERSPAADRAAITQLLEAAGGAVEEDTERLAGGFAQVRAAVREAVGEKDVSGALSLLAASRSDYAASLPEPWAALEKEVEACLQDVVDAAGEAIVSHLDAGDVSAARNALQKLLERLPEARRPAADSFVRRVEKAMAARTESQRKAVEAANTMRRAFGSLDWEVAAEAAKAHPSLLQEYGIVHGVWNRLQSRFGKKSSLRVTLRTPEFEESTAAERSQTLRVASQDGEALRLATARSVQNQFHSVFEIRGPSLASLATSTEGEAPSDLASTLEGLALLHLYVCGPVRASEFLSEPSLSERRKVLENRLRRDHAIWLEPRLAFLKREAERLRNRGEAAERGMWRLLAVQAAALIVGWRDRREDGTPFESMRPELVDLYRAVRLESLGEAASDGAFHAKKVRVESNGRVALLYDFSDEEQLKDFQPAKTAVKNPLKWSQRKRAVLLRGQVRFSSGDPFEGDLVVTATAAATDGEAPNVNVALWTREDDVLEVAADGAGIDLRGWRDDPDGAEPTDVIVVGMGYRLPFDVADLIGDDGGLLSRFRRTVEAFLPAYLRQTTDVVLAAHHGRGLHGDRRELVWEEGTRVSSGAVRYLVGVEDGRLRWELNGRKISLKDSLRLERLMSAPARKGSVTFFTNSSDVQYGKIEIEGRLNPTWWRERRDAQIERELAVLMEKRKKASSK